MWIGQRFFHPTLTTNLNESKQIKDFLWVIAVFMYLDEKAKIIVTSTKNNSITVSNLLPCSQTLAKYIWLLVFFAIIISLFKVSFALLGDKN